MMLKALLFVQFWSVLFIVVERAMMTSVRKSNQVPISNQVFPEK